MDGTEISTSSPGGEDVARMAGEVMDAVTHGRADKDILKDFADTLVAYIPTVICAIVIYIVGMLITRLIIKLIDKAAGRTKVDKTAQDFVGSALRVVLSSLVIVIALSVLGVPMASIITVMGAASVAVGLALQGSLSNVAGGLIILYTKPFEKGHYVELCGVAGTVSRISIMTTEIVSLDNKLIYIPNGQVSSSTLINYSKGKVRRVDYNFSVAYGSDTEKAKSIVLKVMTEHPKVLQDKDKFARITDLADSSVVITMRAWTNVGDYWEVYYDLIENVYKEFTAEGIDIPFPQITVSSLEKTSR